MTPVDMQSIQAEFTSQDQAESVMKKLGSLRGDRFRLERAGVSLGDSRVEFAEEVGSNAPAEFTLSANVPGDATEQARAVILQAGGRML